MKKILTFLMMLLISGSMLMAQDGPKFRYQAVLRDSNNVLVANQSGTVDISLKEGTWVVNEPFTTNANGLVSLELNYSSINAPQGINWNGDTLTAVFTIGSKTITLNTPVTAVPYAFQAGDVRITTPMLEDYFGRAKGGAVDSVYQALLNNPTFSQACRDSAVNYIKANYPIAKDIAYNYLSQVTIGDVQQAYDTMHYIDVAVKQAFYDIIKDYLKNHRSLLLEVAEYYITSATVAEAEELYASFENSTAAPEVRRILLQYFEQYLRSHNLICDNSQNWTLCSAASYVATNTVCPQISSVQGTYYTTNNNIDSVVYQVIVDDMGTVDLSTVTVTVDVKMGQMGDQSETKTLARVPNTNRFRLRIDDSAFVESVNTNYVIVAKLNKQGCQENVAPGVDYTHVPNN